MWCDRCRTDAAAEVSAETGHARCGTCGGDLGPVRRFATDEARELLKRWSTDLDPAAVAPAAVTPIPAEPVAVAAGEAGLQPTAGRVRARRPSPPLRPATTPPKQRLDVPHDGPRETPEPAPSQRMAWVDAPAAGPARPHFDVHTSMATKGERGGRASQVAGQILAYSGVLTLTVGTALVIWGYFGGPADFAPTGWLIATGGQMLLFLGVVNLIAGGLEQTGREVRVRVESLGERLIRIEEVATGHALRGPHAGAAHESPAPRRSRREDREYA